MKKIPVKPDEEQPNESDAVKLLPPPLLPQKLNEFSQPEATVEHTESVSSSSVENVELLCSGEQVLGLAHEFDSFTVSEATDAVADDLLSLSLKVQGRVIPCIPCDTNSPSNDHNPS